MAVTSVEVFDPNTKEWLNVTMPLDDNAIHAAIRKILGGNPAIEIQIRTFPDGRFQVLKPELTAAQKLDLVTAVF